MVVLSTSRLVVALALSRNSRGGAALGLRRATDRSKSGPRPPATSQGPAPPPAPASPRATLDACECAGVFRPRADSHRLPLRTQTRSTRRVCTATSSRSTVQLEPCVGSSGFTGKGATRAGSLSTRAACTAKTDSDAFALAASNGRQLWHRHLTNAHKQFAAVAPSRGKASSS